MASTLPVGKMDVSDYRGLTRLICIIQNLTVRHQVWQSGDSTLMVTQ